MRLRQMRVLSQTLDLAPDTELHAPGMGVIGEGADAAGKSGRVDQVPVTAVVVPVGAGIGRPEPPSVEGADVEAHPRGDVDVLLEDLLVDGVVEVGPPVVPLDRETARELVVGVPVPAPDAGVLSGYVV